MKANRAVPPMTEVKSILDGKILDSEALSLDVVDVPEGVKISVNRI